jgi:hypothetical protein
LKALVFEGPWEMPLIELVAAFGEGAGLFREMAEGRLAAVKVNLSPGS